MSSGRMKLRRRICSPDRSSARAAESITDSMAKTLAGRATPRYGPAGAVFVATPRTVQS